MEKSKIQKWVAEEHLCEKCGKVLTQYFGSGRFCSRSCANSHHHSQETKNNISKGLALSEKRHHSIKRYCSLCNKQIRTNNKSGYCLECLLHAKELKDYRYKNSSKASLSRKTKPHWTPRNNLPKNEKTWMNILNENNIEYKHDFIINTKRTKSGWYRADFYIVKNNSKLDLEIDGKQHNYPERKQHDIIRDNNLIADRYLVYRIPWYNISDEEQNTYIENFLNYYNNL